MKNSTLLACAFAATLTACGGGGGGGGGDSSSGGGGTSPTAAEQVPASASTSVSGFINYLTDLFGLNTDSADPVDVSAVTPVLSDEAPPTALD